MISTGTCLKNIQKIICNHKQHYYHKNRITYDYNNNRTVVYKVVQCSLQGAKFSWANS